VAFWHPSQPDSLSREFVARFLRSAGRSPRHDDAMFYDATALIVEAVRTVGPDRAAVRAYLEQLGRSRPPYQGVTGPIAFTPQARRPLLMTRIRGGRTERVPAP
jgi:ABC-type branched-subunit amino acid transport system substrate-binding protein